MSCGGSWTRDREVPSDHPRGDGLQAFIAIGGDDHAADAGDDALGEELPQQGTDAGRFGGGASPKGGTSFRQRSRAVVVSKCLIWWVGDAGFEPSPPAV